MSQLLGLQPRRQRQRPDLALFEELLRRCEVGAVALTTEIERKINFLIEGTARVVVARRRRSPGRLRVEFMVAVIEGVAVEVAVDCGGAGGTGRGAEVAEVAETHGVHVEVAGGGDANHHFHVSVSLLVHLFLHPYLPNHQYMWYEVASDVCFCEVLR